MNPAISQTSISSVDAQRRRRLPEDEAKLLAQVLAVHGEIVQAGLDPHKIVDVVTRRAQELTHSAGAVVEILDGKHLVYWSASGVLTSQLGLHVNIDNSLSGLCAKTGQILRCDDSEIDFRVNREKCRRVGLRSMLVVPLAYADTTIGVLKVVSPYVRAYSPADERTLSLLNNLIGAMLGHAAHNVAMEAAVNSKAEVDRLVSADRLDAAARIRTIIDDEKFELAIQPIVRIDDEQAVGFEALARFPQSPEGASKSWFDAAWQEGLGLELELAILGKALLKLSRLPEDMYLAVNVSPETAQLPAVEWLCRRYSPHRIVLEITEHASIEDYAALAERVKILKRLGVRIAIDDAGAGFASLRHVLRLEPDLIKLDGSITHDIDRQSRQQNLAAALITFARGTSASIIAEGIETRPEFVTLKHLGIPYGQGYYLGRPALQ